MPGTVSHSDEAGSSGHADVPKALAVDAASSDDLVGVAQPDVQQQQETWVKYNTLQEAQLLPEWRQQDSLMANATVGCGKPHLGSVSQQTEPALPLSASLRIVQAPAAFHRPIVQKKLFRPPFIVRLELRYRRQLDLVVTVIAHVLNDNQYAKPGTWQPLGGPGQADLEGHLLTRRLRVPSTFTAAEKQNQMADPDTHNMYAEDFEFSELNFVKSSRMSKRWLLFTCFFKEEPITVLYKLPTVIISRRTDQYSKAYENLMGQVPQQGIPRARLHALPKAPSGTVGPQLPSALQVLHQYHRSTDGGEGLTPTAPLAAPDNCEVHNTAGNRAGPTEAGAGIDAAHAHGMLHNQHIAAWILQHYASLGFTRALTHADLAALERRVRAGANSPAVQPQAWHDFQDWFCKTMKALKQCEGEWNEARPPCMTGFALDRAAADTALRYEPVGAFLVRMCSEPGLFAISCRTSTDLQDMQLGSAAAHAFASSDGAGNVDHMLLDCVDLQRRPLWHHVLACPVATHLLDPSSHRLYPKNQVHHQLAAQAGDPQPPPPPPTMDVDQLRSLAAHFQSHNTAAHSNRPLHPNPYPQPQPHPQLHPGYAEPQVDPSSNSLQGGAAHPPAGPIPPHGGRELGQGNSGVADSGGQHGLTGADDPGHEAGHVPNIQPRLQALLASLQAQVAGQSPSVQAPPARPATASLSHEDEEEDQAPQQEQAQQQQQQQQAEQQQAPLGPENGLHRPTDSTPGAVNATLQHLLQQSRTSRNQCWHPEEGPQSDNLQNSGASQDRRNSISG